MNKKQTQEDFSDVLSDLESNDQTAIAVLQSFEAAICDWMKYHEDQAAKYRELHRRFLLADVE